MSLLDALEKSIVVCVLVDAGKIKRVRRGGGCSGLLVWVMLKHLFTI